MEYVFTMLIALCGALLFEFLELPVPWLLGALVFVFIGRFFTRIPFQWNIKFRNIGLMVVGFSMGHIFTVAILEQVLVLLPYILIFNVILLLFSIMMAYIIHLYCLIPFSTMIVANVPGGLSQMIIFAEETKRMDVSIVTYFQVLRVFLVVLTIPFLATLFSTEKEMTVVSFQWEVDQLLMLVVLFAFSPLAVKVAQRAYIPVPYFVGPLLYVLIISIIGVSVPEVPTMIVQIAQLFIGAYIGLLLRREAIQFSKKIVIMGIVSTITLILFTLMLSIGLHDRLGESVATIFLGLAPGGLDQMGIVAMSMQENVAFITIFQMFRMLFVFLIVIPILSFLEKKERFVSGNEHCNQKTDVK